MSIAVPFNVRLLTPDDVNLMESLLTAFGKAFDEVETYGASQPSKAYLERLLGSGHFIALAAMKHGSVIVGLAAYELRKFEQERSEIYIYDLAVAAAHRRQGIATALIRQLQNIAAPRAAYVIFVQADIDDAPAIALYTKMGVRENIAHFGIGVAGRPDV